MIFRTLWLILALTFISGTALAACSDPPAPGVDWSDCVKIGQSMDGADLSNANLRGLLLSGSVMTNAVFKGADLIDTRFASTDLTGSDFSGANLVRTTFTDVLLVDTVFHNATMDFVTATNVDATDADFGGAKISDAMDFMMKFCRTIMPDGSIRSGACNEIVTSD